MTDTHTHTDALTHTVIVDPLTHTKATVAATKVKFGVFSFIYSLATACIFYFIDV